MICSHKRSTKREREREGEREKDKQTENLRLLLLRFLINKPLENDYGKLKTKKAGKKTKAFTPKITVESIPRDKKNMNYSKA
jgi:hypothetical protein